MNTHNTNPKIDFEMPTSRLMKELGLDPAVIEFEAYEMYNQYRKYVTIPLMPVYLQSFTVRLNYPTRCKCIFEEALRIRDDVLASLKDWPAPVLELISSAGIGRRKKEKILKTFTGTVDEIHGLVLQLMHRNILNYQPGTRELIEELLFFYLVFRDGIPDPRVVSPDVTESLTAIIEKFFLVEETYREFFENYFRREFAAKIKSEAGISIKENFSITADKQGGIMVLKEEIGLCGEFIRNCRLMRKAVKAPDEFLHSSKIYIRAVPALDDGLVYFNRISMYEYTVAMQKTLENSCGREWDIMIDYAEEGTREWLVTEGCISNGMFVQNADQAGNNLGKAITGIMRFEEDDLAALEKDLEYCTRLWENYFAPLKTNARRREILEEASVMMSFKRLDFVPVKDPSLMFRGIAGHDCSNKSSELIIHPSSCFFKIFRDNEWVGYVTLLAVDTDEKKKALLIDVFNVRIEITADILDMFNQFLDAVSGPALRDGYRYILLPGQELVFSNSLSAPVYDHYYHHERINGPVKLAENFASGFHSLDEKFYIIARDLMEHGQLMLFD